MLANNNESLNDALIPAEKPGRDVCIQDLIQQSLDPVFAAFRQMIGQNNEMLSQIAGSMTAQSDRMNALEKLIRLSIPVTPAQVRYINNQIRHRARELLAKKEAGYEDDQKAVASLGRMIRKTVLVRYGITALNELPKCEYSVVISQIEIYNDALAVRDIVKEVRKRAEEAKEKTGAGT